MEDMEDMAAAMEVACTDAALTAEECTDVAHTAVVACTADTETVRWEQDLVLRLERGADGWMQFKELCTDSDSFLSCWTDLTFLCTSLSAV